MPKLTIGVKMGVGYLVLGGLLLLCGLAGYLVEQRLMQALGRITGPMQTLEQTVTDGMEGMQNQIVAVERIMSGQKQAVQDLSQALEATDLAYRNANASGLLSEKQVGDLSSRLQVFDQARQTLLAAHQRRLSAEGLLGLNLTAFQEFFNESEKLASQQLLKVQMNSEEHGDEAESIQLEAGDSINAATEARLALLTRNYLLQRLVEDPAGQSLAQQMDTVLEDLKHAVEVVGQPNFFSAQVERGEYAGRTYRDVLARLLGEHVQAYADARGAFEQSIEARGVYVDAAKELQTLGENIGRFSAERMRAEVEQVESVAATGGWAIFTSIIVGLFVALLVTMTSLRTVAAPVKEVSRVMLDMAEGEGDLRSKLPETSKDEVGDLARAFNRFSEKIRGTVVELQQAIHRLSAGSGDIANVAERTAAEVTKQQEDIDGIANEINELYANVQSVAGDTSQAAEQTRVADQAVREADQIVSETREVTNRLSDEVDRATDVINRLGDESKRIGGVLDVIRDISEQTNLLALNAAIEAARAGEHGRGFAVVADEVRNLAARTHDSTNEIRDMIDRLQQGASEAVEAMSGSRGLSQTNVDHAERTSEALRIIDEAVKSLTSLNHHVAEASKRQSVSAENVNNSVGSIRQVAATTAQDTVELNRTTEDLVHLADELDRLAGQFKV